MTVLNIKIGKNVAYDEYVKKFLNIYATLLTWDAENGDMGTNVKIDLRNCTEDDFNKTKQT